MEFLRYFLAFLCVVFTGIGGATALKKDRQVRQRRLADASTGGSVKTTSEEARLLVCGNHELAPGNYSIRSPNYPEKITAKYHCKYKIKTSSGNQIGFTCIQFGFLKSKGCKANFLRFQWTSSGRIQGRKLCGYRKNLPKLKFRPSNVTIIIHSDGASKTRYSCNLLVKATTAGQACRCGVANEPSARTAAGGKTGDPERYSFKADKKRWKEYPWMAAVVWTGDSELRCVGTLLNSRYVMSTAHCKSAKTSRGLDVLLRKYDDAGTIRKRVERVIPFKDVNVGRRRDRPLALLKLASAVQFPQDNTIAPVCLPPDDQMDYSGQTAIHIGRGVTDKFYASNDNLVADIWKVPYIDWNPSGPGILSSDLLEMPQKVLSSCSVTWSGNSGFKYMCTKAPSKGRKRGCLESEGSPLLSIGKDNRHTIIGVRAYPLCVGFALSEWTDIYYDVSSILPFIRNEMKDGDFCTET